MFPVSRQVLEVYTGVKPNISVMPDRAVADSSQRSARACMGTCPEANKLRELYLSVSITTIEI